MIFYIVSTPKLLELINEFNKVSGYTINIQKSVSFLVGGDLVAKSCPTLATPWIIAHQAPSIGFPDKNTGVGCHFLLQGILLTQGSNLGLLHCRQILYHLSYKGIHEL